MHSLMAEPTDISCEPLIPLSEVPRRCEWLPERDGRKVHVITLYRWAQQGLRGHRLEAVRANGGLCTSDGALRRFFQRTTNPKADPSTPTNVQREKQKRRAAAVLDAAGIGKGKNN
jgi:hypothetical protein